MAILSQLWSNTFAQSISCGTPLVITQVDPNLASIKLTMEEDYKHLRALDSNKVFEK